MSDPTPIALLRHGRTAWNQEGRLQGATDIPLLAEERHRMARLELPSPWDRARVVCSPLRRARETAEALAPHRAPIVEPALREMSWGDWEGRRGEDLSRDLPDAYRPIEDWGWDYRPPGGESPRVVRERLAPWLGGLEEPTLVVSHIGVMRVLLALAHGWDFRGPPPFKVKRDRLYIIHLFPDGGLRPEDTPIRLETREKSLPS